MTNYYIPSDDSESKEFNNLRPAITPRKRVVRTAVQVAVAVLLAIPAAIGAMSAAGVDAPSDLVALVVGITGALTVLISAGQNAYDARTR